jgi:hypothetical protein
LCGTFFSGFITGLQLDLAAMQVEVSATRTLCEAIHSPVVFAHNDLLSGNILVLQVRFTAS